LDKRLASTNMLLARLLGMVRSPDANEIEQLLRDAIESYNVGPPGVPLAVALMWLAEHLHEHGRAPEALPLLLESIAAHRAELNPGGTPTEGYIVSKLIMVLRTLGQDEQANQLLPEIPESAQWIGKASEHP